MKRGAFTVIMLAIVVAAAVCRTYLDLQAAFGNYCMFANNSVQANFPKSDVAGLEQFADANNCTIFRL